MSNIHLRLVWGARSFGNSSRRLVMAALADHADTQGQCFPGLPLLQRETELSKRTLVRCLADLEDNGWIEVARKSVGRLRTGNSYALNLQKLQDDQRLSKGATVTPMESDIETSTNPESIGDVVAPIEQKGEPKGATVTPVKVPNLHVKGAKSASLYRRTPKNPQSNQRGGDTAPPFIRPQDGNPEQCAKTFFERIGQVASKSTLALAASAIKIIAAEENLSPWAAMLRIETVAVADQARGKAINNFWFEDGKWRASPSEATVGVAKSKAADCSICENRRMVVSEVGGSRMALQCECVTGKRSKPGLAEAPPEGADVELAQRTWNAMKAPIKAAIGPHSFETWIRPITPLWVVRDELVVQIPTSDFEHIADRYGISDYLPPALGRLSVLTAKGCAA